MAKVNKPTKPALWSSAKSQAKSKFDVYPSAYANAWAAKNIKLWVVDGKLFPPRKQKEKIMACWTGYTARGMKLKNGKLVPNCVPKKG